MEGQTTEEGPRRSARLRKKQTLTTTPPDQPGSFHEVKPISKKERKTRKKRDQAGSDTQSECGPNSTTAKKPKTRNPKQPKTVSRKELSDNDSANESCTEKALRMEEILRVIFSYIPSSMLLHSCSFVNKTWNTEARTFIRDYRLCAFKYTEFFRPCQLAEKIHQFLDPFIANRRVIPINCLQLRYDSQTCEEMDGSDDYCYCKVYSSNDEASDNSINLHKIMMEKRYRKLASKLKLQHFVISKRDCGYCRPFLEFIRHNCSTLRSLRIEGTHLYCRVLQMNEWQPVFPRLKEFGIEDKGFENGSEETQKQILRWMLKNAPNLKKIRLQSLDMLSIVPEELLSDVKLPGELDIRLSTKQDINLLWKISQARSCLSLTRIYEPHAHIKDDWDDELADSDLRRQFDLYIERILQNHHDSLRTIEIIGAYPLGVLLYPPLLNVSKLAISKRFKGELDELWDALASINFESALPNLAEVEIKIKAGFPGIDNCDFFNEWPVANNGSACHGSNSVRKLELHVQIRKLTLRPFQVLFPNVSVLHFNVRGCEFVDRTRDFGPVGEIWESWSQLEELKFYGWWNILNRNYDLDFCGIHEEEANFLKLKSDEYLRSVHIVPIRPCLLTMPKLKTLWFEENFFVKVQGSRENFISKLTQLVAFDRMPGLDVTLPRNVV